MTEEEEYAQEVLHNLELAIEQLSGPLNDALALARQAGLAITFPMIESPMMYAPCACGSKDCTGEYIFHNLEAIQEAVH